MSKAMMILEALLLGYIIGNISPSFIIGMIKGYDVRKSGSGNAGASNTVILAGKWAGTLVAVLDILKAWGSWKLAELLFPTIYFAGAVAGIGCTLGHMYPVVLHFKGGRGFACLGGIALASQPRSFLLMLLIAIVLGVLVRYVAYVTCMMWAIYPAYFGFTTALWTTALIMLIPLPFVIQRHMENFRRIREGKELRLSYLFHKDRELERIGYENK